MLSAPSVPAVLSGESCLELRCQRNVAKLFTIFGEGPYKGLTFNRFSSVRALVGTFNLEKVLVGAFPSIVKILSPSLVECGVWGRPGPAAGQPPPCQQQAADRPSPALWSQPSTLSQTLAQRHPGDLDTYWPSVGSLTEHIRRVIYLHCTARLRL